MKIIYTNDGDTKLEQKSKNRWVLLVDWEGDKKKFWLNFPFQLLKIIEKKKIGDNYHEFTIKANSVMSLKDLLKKYKNKLSYEMCMELLYNIGNQIQTLERFHLGIPYVDLEDVVVVDENKFLFLNDQKLLDIKKGQLEIAEPLKKSSYFSPELSKISKIPTTISYKSSFYSLARLTGFCFTGEKVGIEDDHKEIFKNIYTTKLYWALLRMLENNPNNRFYLII